MSEELQEALEEISMFARAPINAQIRFAQEYYGGPPRPDSAIDMRWGHVNRDSDEENGKVCRGQRH